MNFEKFTPTMIEVARQGGNVAEIVSAIGRIEKPEYVVVFVALFVRAFKMQIKQAMELDGWLRGSLPDEEIDQIMMPLIRKNLGMEDWPEKQS